MRKRRTTTTAMLTGPLRLPRAQRLACTGTDDENGDSHDAGLGDVALEETMVAAALVAELGQLRAKISALDVSV
ncbi:hypothetical protein [Oryza sativa Japonica Group]|uniref:Uncharacterized protein n=1 Tax=Oryza sativa subsp. japonica TaxID=39947 RepID=Q5N8Q5_ORYSJ|nr:hypothetical protein [Oryza sativa Japonica Group]